MFSMDIDPMDTLHQRNRRELEVDRYPQLVDEIVRRNPTFCQHVTERWQALVLGLLTERLIPARVSRPVAFDTFGHWGPWAYAENWGGLATARFINEASMLSWLIASYHIDGNFFAFTMLHSWVVLFQFTPVDSFAGEQAKTDALDTTASSFADSCMPRGAIRMGPWNDPPISGNIY